MRKEYIVENLGCADCAQKMEDQINKLDQVERARLNFLTQKLKVSYQGDEDQVLDQMQKIVSKIERKAKIVS